jgi:SAM-dependent methyltransferase
MLKRNWYEKSFGKDYLLVYQHRDYTGAEREVDAMIQWIDLSAGARILDLCCGMGRHSITLARMGYQVTGVDLSKVLLDTAMQADPDEDVRWVRGDMRKVPLEEQFDAVVNLFTSFGYFDLDEQNIRVIREIDRLLLLGGRFLIDYLNPIHIERSLVPSSLRMSGDTQILEVRRLENGFVKKDITIVGEDLRERKYTEQVRLYELTDFEQMLSANTTLEIDCVYGDYDGTAYCQFESPRMILTGTKKGAATR